MARVASVPGPLKRRAVAPLGTWVSRKLPDLLVVAEMRVPGPSTRSACELLRSFPWMVAPDSCGAGIPEPHPASNSNPALTDPMEIRMTSSLPQPQPQLVYPTRDRAPMGQIT